MAGKNGFLSEQAMADLAREALEDLRKDGISPTELKRLENVLREGNVGEAFILSGLLKTVLNEISPDASHKKLLQVYRELEVCCYALVELSRDLFDVEVWQHYRASGYESFDAYCAAVLKVSPEKIKRLKLMKDRRLPRPGNAGPAKLFAWLFEAAEILADAKKDTNL